MATREALIDLLERTAKAHHETFADTDGFDPEWPRWYAQHMQKELAEELAIPIAVEDLQALLVTADLDHRASAADQDWKGFYANRLAALG